MTIGELIKSRRKQLGITQKDLANTICTQATISKIEKNDLMPSAALLKDIAHKLEVSVAYFYGEEGHPLNENEIVRLMDQITLALNQNEFKKALELIRNNQKLIDSLTDKQHINFFRWAKASLDYYLYKKTEKAIKELKSLLNEKPLRNHAHIDTLGLLAIIYYEEENYKVANTYFEEAIELFDEEISFKTKAKILYNYSLNLELLGHMNQALEITLEGIELLISNQSMYLLGYFYFYKGYLFKRLKGIDEAIEAYKTSATIFEILNYNKMHGMVQVNLLELKQEKRDREEKKN